MATPLKILFADDDLKYSLLLKRFLEKEGYEVAYTGNGMMALEQFPVVKPDPCPFGYQYAGFEWF